MAVITVEYYHRDSINILLKNIMRTFLISAAVAAYVVSGTACFAADNGNSGFSSSILAQTAESLGVDMEEIMVPMPSPALEKRSSAQSRQINLPAAFEPALEEFSSVISLETKNADIVAAFNRLKNTRAGKELIEETERLTTEKGIPVVIDMVLQWSDSSDASFQGGKTLKKRISSWTGNWKDDWVNSETRFRVSINPLESVATATYQTGLGPKDIILGIPLDELIYHELIHIQQFLKYDSEANLALMEFHQRRPAGLNETELEKWENKWSNWAEYEAVTRTNLEYRKEKGVPYRTAHNTTERQKRYEARIKSRIENGSLRYKPLLEEPVFLGDEWRKRVYRDRILKALSAGDIEKADSFAEALIKIDKNKPKIPIG